MFQENSFFRRHSSLLISAAVHAVFFGAALFSGRAAYNAFSGGGQGAGGYYAIEEYFQQNRLPDALPVDANSADAIAAEAQETSQINPPAGQQGQNGNGQGAGNLFGGADTTGLRGLYSENTLGVSIRYPSGWSFMDQNRNNKLDGVTFLGQPTSRGEIPYVFINVQEKYLFNPARFSKKETTARYEIFYNDPIVLEGQYTQVYHVVTSGDQDYSLKLIVKGKESFQEFQPVFLGMIKTFSFR